MEAANRTEVGDVSGQTVPRSYYTTSKKVSCFLKTSFWRSF